MAAVEVYTGQIVPPKFATALGARGCGVVVIWSKEGERRVRRPSQITASAASEIARLIDGRQIFTAAQVDISARQDSARLIRPTYPDALYETQVTGSVMVEFIVTASGEVDPDRISIVYATHPGFVDAVKIALEDAVYAMRGGFPVYRVVQHEFQFIPDAASRRRR